MPWIARRQEQNKFRFLLMVKDDKNIRGQEDDPGTRTVTARGAKYQTRREELQQPRRLRIPPSVRSLLAALLHGENFRELIVLLSVDKD